MELNIRSSNNIDILTLTGNIDAFEVSRLSEWFEANPKAARVVVSMEGVGFIDSSGLSTLVKGLKRCRQNLGDLVLCHLQPAVLMIFKLTRLDKAFSLYEDEDSAILSFKDAASPAPESPSTSAL